MFQTSMGGGGVTFINSARACVPIRNSPLVRLVRITHNGPNTCKSFLISLNGNQKSVCLCPHSLLGMGIVLNDHYFFI